jgi:poly-gamma-glutamate synthesis protein (capsule biosynthesis protein)
MVQIIIGGDVCPVGKVETAFRNGQSEIIFNDLLPIIISSDFSVINLECPLITGASPIYKDGVVLGTSTACVNGIKHAQISAVNLANNHILDHGEQGLKSTIQTLSEVGILTFGAGKNLEEAQRPLIKCIQDKKIGFLGIAEHEFSIAGRNSWGANPIDIIRIIRNIKRFRDHIDYLVILVHGGKEHYLYPTPNLQKNCRFFIEEGADAVICQHSHCAGSYEYYQNRPIIYGQGNFIFERLQRKNKTWYEGFLVSLNFKEDNRIETRFIPYYQSKGFLGARRMDPEDEKIFLALLDKRSEDILSPDFVEKKWIELCINEKYLYASRILGYNKYFRFLNRKIHFSDWLYSKKTKMMIQNVVECETHREGLETLWKNKNIDF